MKSNREWLALAACTETNRPHEMQYVMAVILNRLRAGKTWASSIVGVVRQPKQFSGFNATAAMEDDRAWETVRNRKDKDGNPAIPEERYRAALACADDMLSRPAHLYPLDPASLWFFSLQSMEPPGRVPEWAQMDYYTYSVPGVDPCRFLFCMAVPRTHPERGNGRRFDYSKGAA